MNAMMIFLASFFIVFIKLSNPINSLKKSFLPNECRLVERIDSFQTSVPRRVKYTYNEKGDLIKYTTSVVKMRDAHYVMIPVKDTFVPLELLFSYDQSSRVIRLQYKVDNVIDHINIAVYDSLGRLVQSINSLPESHRAYNLGLADTTFFYYNPEGMIQKRTNYAHTEETSYEYSDGKMIKSTTTTHNGSKVSEYKYFSISEIGNQKPLPSQRIEKAFFPNRPFAKFPIKNAIHTTYDAKGEKLDSYTIEYQLIFNVNGYLVKEKEVTIRKQSTEIKQSYYIYQCD